MKRNALLLISLVLWPLGAQARGRSSARPKAAPHKAKAARSKKPKSIPKAQAQETSKIQGRAMVTNLPPSPDTPLSAYLEDCEVVIVTAKGRREVKRIRSGKDGLFEATLPVGKYIFYPAIRNRNGWNAEETEFEVKSGEVAEVEARYDGLW